MKTYAITIQTENAAFECQPGAEVARILRDLADQCERLGVPRATTLHDINGNRVGRAYIGRSKAI